MKRRLLVGLAALAATLALGEGLARLLDAPVEEGKAPQVEGPHLRVPDPEFGWRLAPSLGTYHRSRDYAVAYRTNAAGARASREYAKEKRAGTARIAIYGDSFVFGIGVEERERFADRLETLLPGTETLVFGVPGYGFDQALLLFEREGAAYEPDVVMLGVLMEHVTRVLAREHRGPAGPGEVRVDPKPRFVLGDSGLELTNLPVPPPRTERAPPRAESASLLDRSRLASLVARRIRTLAARRDPFPGWDPDEEGGRLGRALLERFAASVRAAGAEPLVVLLGDRSYLDGRLAALARRSPIAALLEHCRAHGVPALDLLPAFDVAKERGLGPLFFPWDGHWTPEGHRVAAEAIAAFLAPRSSSDGGSPR